MPDKIDKHQRLRPHLPAATRRAAWCWLVMLPGWLLPLDSTLAAIPPEWKNTAYAYEAQHKPVREVLEDFAQTFGTQLQVEGLLEGNVNGKIRANTPQSLLDRLGVEHRFQWYMYNNTLYISTLDQQESARLEVSSETISDLKQALTDIGLLDSRFGWGELPEDGVVLVSGPKVYIEQIKRFSSQRRGPPDGIPQRNNHHPRCCHYAAGAAGAALNLHAFGTSSTLHLPARIRHSRGSTPEQSVTGANARPVHADRAEQLNQCGHVNYAAGPYQPGPDPR